MMSPAGDEHGRTASRINWTIGPFVAEHNLGDTYAAETGFLIAQNPDTVRAPDFAFISRERLEVEGRVSGYRAGAPDLVAEVVSPNDTFTDVEAKVLEWLSAGAALVWVFDPAQRNVTVYRSPSSIQVINEDEQLDAPDLLPGWQAMVGDLFP